MKEWIIKYWLETLFGIIVAICGVCINSLRNKVRKMKIENDAIRDGMMALLRSEIITLYNHYNGKKFLPYYAMETLNKLYIPYKKLGGNGAIERLIKKLEAMPTDPEDGEEDNDI
jgi:hypothetical protein